MVVTLCFSFLIAELDNAERIDPMPQSRARVALRRAPAQLLYSWARWDHIAHNGVAGPQKRERKKREKERRREREEGKKGRRKRKRCGPL